MEIKRPRTNGKKSKVEKLTLLLRDPIIFSQNGLQTKIPEKSRLARPSATSIDLEKGSSANIHSDVLSAIKKINKIKAGLSRQNKNIKHKDLLQSEMCKLVHEVKVIASDILAKKQQWSVVNDDVGAKLTSELIEINERLTDYINLNKDKRTKDTLQKLEIEIEQNLIMLQNMAGKKISENKIFDELSCEGEETTKFKDNDEKNWEMKPYTQDESIKLSDKIKELKHKIEKRINFITENVKLEKQIQLLHPKFIKNDEDEEKNKQENLADTENDEKLVFDQKVQDCFKIMNIEQEENDNKNKDEIKKLESDSEAQFEQMIKYNSLQEEIHERIRLFENKLSETIEAQDNLEKFIKENRNQIDLESLKNKAMESIKQYYILFQDRMKSMT